MSIRLFLVSAVLFAAPALHAETLACRAKVTVHTYDVAIDSVSHLMTVTGSDGLNASGPATYSTFRGGIRYFLPIDFNNAMALDMPNGATRWNLCLDPNTCFGCIPH